MTTTSPTASLADTRARIVGFVRDHRLPLVVERDDGRTLGLLEPRSGQSLTLPLDELTRIEARTSPLRPAPYLVLLRQDGRQLVLADVGFAFAPLTHNSGPLPELPETFCFADLDTLLAGVAQLTTQGRVAEATRGVLACIALVDGARACGFQVGREESRLEAALTRLERG